MNTMWGKLASDILLQEWDTSMDDVNKLQEVIDNNVGWGLNCNGGCNNKGQVFVCYNGCNNLAVGLS